MDAKETKGFNRNEYFDWKKEKVQELAKKGMKVADIAQELNMGEEDMYSFLSRNFGGVRRLRESVGVNPDGVFDSATGKHKAPNSKPIQKVEKVEKVPKLDFQKVVKEETKIGVIAKGSPINSLLREVLSKEKKTILESFKEDLLADKAEIVELMKQGLEKTRIELLNNFQKELMSDLSEMVKEL